MSASMRGSHSCRFSDDGTSCGVQKQKEVLSIERQPVTVISASVSSLEPSSESPGTQHPSHRSDPVEFHPACSQSWQFEESSRDENSLADNDALSMHRSGIKKVQNVSTVKSYQQMAIDLNVIKCSYCMKRFDHGSHLLEHLNNKCSVFRELCDTKKNSNTNRASRRSETSSKSRASNTGGTLSISEASCQSRASSSNKCGIYVQDEAGLKALVTTPHNQKLSESRNPLEVLNPNTSFEPYKRTCIRHETKRIVKVKNEVRDCSKNLKKDQTCPSCQESFSKKGNLYRHIWLRRCPVLHKLDSEGKRLDCCREARNFQTPVMLTQHVAKEHRYENNSKPFDKEAKEHRSENDSKPFNKEAKEHRSENDSKPFDKEAKENRSKSDRKPFDKEAKEHRSENDSKPFDKEAKENRSKSDRKPFDEAKEHRSENDSKPFDIEPTGIVCIGCGREFKLLKYLRQHYTLNRCKREHKLNISDY